MVELSEHARQQMGFRGCTESEIEQAIRTQDWKPAELGRLECRLTVPFQGEWNGKSYPNKTIRPIFVQEKDKVVVVTVYVYYG